MFIHESTKRPARASSEAVKELSASVPVDVDAHPVLSS